MLQFENLCAGYDGCERLHRITADLRPGLLTAVIGPNGCGKSTLMKCAAGVLRPTSGTLRIDGRPYGGMSPKALARLVSYMPQSRITPDISVRGLTAHGRYPHLKWGQNLRSVDRQIIAESLRRTDLLGSADRSVATLSGGERQRAYLSMMLAQQTPVMLLDEPAAHLDPAARFSLMELLRALCAEGRSAVIVLHDLSLAMEYADELLLMQDGRLVLQGTPDAVCQSGRLQEVFGINVECTDDGRYLFFSRRQEGSR